MTVKIGARPCGAGLGIASAPSFLNQQRRHCQRFAFCRIIRCTYLVLLCAAVGASQSLSQQEKARTLERTAEQRSQLAKNKALLDAFDKGNEANSKAVEMEEATRSLAGEYVELARKQISKQWETAIQSFEKASEIDPKQHFIWGNLADCYVALANFMNDAQREVEINKAAAAFQKAIELKPDEARYHHDYALALVKLRRFDESLAEATRAAQSDPFHAGSYFYSLGTALQNAEQVDRSGQAFMKAIEAEPNYANAHFQYGVYLASKAIRTPEGKIVWQPGTVELQKYLVLEPHGQFADEAKRLLDPNTRVQVDLAPVITAPAPFIYGVGGDVSAPITLYRVEPEYTEEARAAGLSGPVTVYVEIGPDGLAHNMRVTEGLAPGLDERAIDSISKWRFQPAIRQGQPVTVKSWIRVTFSLSSSTQAPNGHPKLERALGIAANVATQLYLTNTCPQLRRKPLLFWTAGDLQTWQVCTGNGLFIGPLYIYLGPQQ